MLLAQFGDRNVELLRTFQEIFEIDLDDHSQLAVLFERPYISVDCGLEQRFGQIIDVIEVVLHVPLDRLLKFRMLKFIGKIPYHFNQILTHPAQQLPLGYRPVARQVALQYR